MANLIVPLVLVAAATLQSRCAQPEAKADNEAWSAPVMRTGSNLPVGREKEGKPASMTEEEKRALDQALNRGKAARPPMN